MTIDTGGNERCMMLTEEDIVTSRDGASDYFPLLIETYYKLNPSFWRRSAIGQLGMYISVFNTS